MPHEWCIAQIPNHTAVENDQLRAEKKNIEIQLYEVQQQVEVYYAARATAMRNTLIQHMIDYCVAAVPKQAQVLLAGRHRRARLGAGPPFRQEQEGWPRHPPR